MYRAIIQETMSGGSGFEIYIINEETKTVEYILGPYINEEEAKADVNNILEEMREKNNGN